MRAEKTRPETKDLSSKANFLLLPSLSMVDANSAMDCVMTFGKTSP